MAHSLTIKRVLKATPEEIFSAWTEHEKMKKWLSPEVLSVESARSDNKVGGEYVIAMKDGEKNEVHTAIGVFKTYEPNRSFAVTWNWEGMEPPETLLTIELKPVSETETEITLTHSGFPVAEAADEHKNGWESTLNNFEKAFH